jgi:hypothetical protein
MLLFKDENYVLLDLSTSQILLNRTINSDFKTSDDIKHIDGSWVQNGFNAAEPNSGIIFLYKV